MRYRASFLAYAFWVHKNATPKNWLMRVKGLKVGVLRIRMSGEALKKAWLMMLSQKLIPKQLYTVTKFYC